MVSVLSTADKREVRLFGKLVAAAAFLSFFLIALGATVRANDAGLACPDWPLCYSQVVPVFDMKIFLEWFHRLVAGTLSVLLLVASYKLLKSKVLRTKFGAQITAALVLLGSQIILGGLTVLHLLEPKIVSLHLINAILFFAILIWMVMRARALDKPDVASRSGRTTPALRNGLVVLTSVLFSQVFIGGMVSSNHAGLACPDFPKCFDMWMPPVSFHVWLQMIHRYMAFAVLALSFGVSFIAMRATLSSLARHCIRWIPILIVAQIGLGLVNIFYYLPEWASVAHLANAVLVFTLALGATLDVWLAQTLVAGMPEMTSARGSHAPAALHGKHADERGLVV